MVTKLEQLLDLVNPNSRKVLPQNVQDAIDYGCGDVNNIIIN